jgi:DNA polymerase III alpha subunit
MKQYVECHCHTASLDTASSIENFAKREVELGSGYLTSTDHGTLQATRTIYDLCTSGKFKGKLKPILGTELYFRDDNCSILTAAGAPKSADGTFRDTFKYGHLTVHALDEAAFSALTRTLSDADLRAEQHGSEAKPLYNWAGLEELGAHNVTAGSGCLIGAVSRHLLRKDPQTAVKYYERLRSIFKPGNFFAEVFPHVVDRNWESKVEVTDRQGVVTTFRPWKKVRCLGDKESIEISDLAKEFRSNPSGCVSNRMAISEVMEARAWKVLDKPIEFASVLMKEGWVANECTPSSTDGDLQRTANQFILMMANKYGDPVQISGDTHFATPDEKIVQDVRLGQSGSWRMSNSYHRRTSDEAWGYFRDHMGVPQARFEEWIENGYAWAHRFDGFKFSPRQTLPVKFYPEDTLRHTMALIKKHGRMQWSNKEWCDRLDQEIQLLHLNGTVDLLPYFMPPEEVMTEYLKKGLLTGPGRGSAAGCLLAYLLGITHVDPMKYGLSLDRFLTLDRIKTGRFPDIDNDLSTRTPLEEHDEEMLELEMEDGTVKLVAMDELVPTSSGLMTPAKALGEGADVRF